MIGLNNHQLKDLMSKNNSATYVVGNDNSDLARQIKVSIESSHCA